jgi:hypothetical protein
LTSILRQRTIAWDRFRDLHDLYRNNGSVYDPSGKIVLQGHIMLMYDQGAYSGTFRSFEFEETTDSPFAFKVSWLFKVETTIWHIAPKSGIGRPIWGPSARVPTFQGRNALDAPNRVAASEAAEAEKKRQEQLDFERKVQLAGETGAQLVTSAAKFLFDQTAIGRVLRDQAEAKAALLAERRELLRQAVGAPTPQEQYEQDRKARGLPPSPSIPTTSEPYTPEGI